MTVTIVFESAETFYLLHSHLDDLPKSCRQPFETPTLLTDLTDGPTQTVITLGSDQDALALEAWCHTKRDASEPSLQRTWTRAIADVRRGRRVSPRDQQRSPHVGS
jgi:hypothetical protein